MVDLLNSEFLDSELLFSFDVINNQIICDTGETLKLLVIARALPNQRLVCKCLFNDMPVYAKLFIGLRANIHAGREAAGIKLLINAKILTPTSLLQTTSNNQPVMVYQAIENSFNADDFMRNASYVARRDIAERLTQTVANHHHANLMQTDIHLKNFLVAGTQIYTIDGDGVAQTSSVPATSQRQKHRNLATLFSKMDALDDDFMQNNVVVYCEALNMPYSTEFFIKLWLLTKQIRQQTTSNYADKKVFRTCTDVRVTKNTQQFLAVSSNFNIQNQQLDNLDFYLNNSAKNIKNGNTCTVVQAEIAGKHVVIKRYNVKSIWHGFKLAFKKSRAAKSWANAHRLMLLNIATPQPLALIEEKVNLINNKSYFLSEFIDAPDIAEFFAKTLDIELKQSVAYETARLFYKLSILQISHGDCKASNVKVQNGKPVLLDLDSMQAYRNSWLFERAHIKDLKRFMQNWNDDATSMAIFKHAFLLAYDEVDDFQFSSLLERAGIA